MKILFVDDEQPILDMVENYFSTKDHKVFLAHNGKEALEVLGREKIDCCFTDLNMPGMDGMELARQVQNLDNTIPMIVMTGYPSLEATISTLRSGVVDFLIKPIQLRQMDIVMRTALKRREIILENTMLKKELENKAHIERAHHHLQEQAHDLAIRNDTIETLESASSVKDIFARTLHLSMRIADPDASFLFMTGGKDREPLCVMSMFRKPGAGQGCNSSLGEAITLWAIKTPVSDLPLRLKRQTADGSLPKEARFLAAVPITMNNRSFGFLAAINTEQEREITSREMEHLSFVAEKAGLCMENFGLYENIYENLFSTLYAFVETLEARDAYTRQHSLRVTKIAELLAEKTGVPSMDMEILHVAGNLHDIGKIGIPDSILLKPGKLTDEEFDFIKRHPDIGANIVGYMGLWDKEREIIRHHHEKFDGTGYPMGLAGRDIPLLARILAVSDVYDAVTTNRAYRKRLPEEVCKKIIREGAGTHFDPLIVEAFFELYGAGVIQEALEPLTPKQEEC